MLYQVPCLSLLQRLTFLDASDNEIGALPAKFGELKWLKVARLSRNHIVDMRPFVGLTACEELGLAHNEITQIPDTISQMTSLVTLDLSHNGLVSLHPAICSVSLCLRVEHIIIVIIIIIVFIIVTTYC